MKTQGFAGRAATGLLLSLPVAAAAWACFTEDRAAALQARMPEMAVMDHAHHMHNQPRIPYEFRGAAACDQGMSDIFPCQEAALAGWLELPGIGGGNGTDNWGWKHEASGRYFALMGRTNGVAFVEMTDPENPVYIGNLPRPDGVPASTWSDMKTYQDHAFIVADAVMGHGMLVFDLTRLLPSGMSLPVTFTPDAHYTGFNRAHNIAINTETGFAYAVGGDTCAGGLHMVDISDPLQPVQAGCFSADGYTHDVQCVIYRGPDQRYHEKEVCFASNENSVTVVDVTNKSAPVMVGRHTYNNSAYTHQGWLTEDQRYFVTDDEIDEIQGLTPDERTRTLIFDLQDLEDAPEPAAYLADGSAIDHNQYVVGNYIFQANYRRGMRVLRINDPATADLTEVAFFDTYPEGEGLGFSGAWNVFPFFDNGTVLVSDMNRGLFVIRITEPDVLATLLPPPGPLLQDRFEVSLAALLIPSYLAAPLAP